jgi:hypothetical protein
VFLVYIWGCVFLYSTPLILRNSNKSRALLIKEIQKKMEVFLVVKNEDLKQRLFNL